MLFLWTFYLSKESWQKKIHIDNTTNNWRLQSWLLKMQLFHHRNKTAYSNIYKNIYIFFYNIHNIIFTVYWSNKCSLGEHKKCFTKSFNKYYRHFNGSVCQTCSKVAPQTNVIGEEVSREALGSIAKRGVIMCISSKDEQSSSQQHRRMQVTWVPLSLRIVLQHTTNIIKLLHQIWN